MDYKTISLLCQIKDKITGVVELLDEFDNRFDNKNKVSRLLRIYHECSMGKSFKRAEFRRKYGQTLGEAVNSLNLNEIIQLKNNVTYNSGLYRLALKRRKSLKESPWGV